MYWHDIDIMIMKYWLVFKDKYWVRSKTQEEKFAVTPFIRIRLLPILYYVGFYLRLKTYKRNYLFENYNILT